ncbi:MAG: hypothetical protein HY863_18490 [Chloroflexi bacterium]|nr:hypothetical protein [Chloroflexota bacterium]
MLDKFWESISSNLVDRWLEYIFGPPFLFWVGGLGLYVWQTGWQNLLTELQSMTLMQQSIWIILALLVLVFSSLLMQALRFPILRLLEGYWPWPFNYLGLGIIALRRSVFKKKYDELRHLKEAESKRELNAKQSEKLIKLDIWAHWLPAKANEMLPTALGNILRSRERSPESRYGLDAVVCWPRLWPLLPENVRNDLDMVRSTLDRLVELWFWGLLFFLWAYWTPWAVVIGLLWMILTYGTSLQAAMAYGDLLESAFDLHRLLLYSAMGWPRPANSEEEKALGIQLTEFLWRGTLHEPLIYATKEG